MFNDYFSYLKEAIESDLEDSESILEWDDEEEQDLALAIITEEAELLECLVI